MCRARSAAPFARYMPTPQHVDGDKEYKLIGLLPIALF